MRKSLLLPILIFAFTSSIGQVRNISGIITDEKGDPLSHISIVVKGTNSGTTSRADGQYSLLVRWDAKILVFSGVGFQPEEVLLGSESILNVTLKTDEKRLSEVVVVGYGTTRARSLTSSVSRVVGNEIETLKTWKRSGQLDENSVRLSVGDKDHLPLKSVQVAVQVDGFRARVLFDYFFYSDKDKLLRGDFRLKLPAGASPYYFAFGGITYLDKQNQGLPLSFVSYPVNKKIELTKDTILRQRSDNWSNIKEALVVPKEKAAHAFGEVVRGRVDPALMEWVGADVFSCSLYPIENKKLHRVVIGYDINLSEAGNAAILNLVLPYGNIPKELDIDIINNADIAHKIEPSIAAKAVVGNRVKYHLEDFKQETISISTRSTGTVFLQNEDKERYFALTHQPHLSETLAGPGAEQAIFLLDVSLSSQPDKFNIWLKMIGTLLNNNRQTIKKFAVLCFNTNVSWWRNSYTPNNASTVGDFLEYAERLSLMGATDIGLALKTASKPGWAKDLPSPKTLFLLSDGDASWGEDNLYQLSRPIPVGDKVFAFTTGLSGTDTRVLDHLCRQTNGAVFSVLNEEEAEKVSTSIKFLPWRIKDIQLRSGSDILIAGRPYNIFPGQKLLITGRGTVQPGDELVLQLAQGETEKTIIIPAASVISSDLTKRIYGQTAVTQLEDFSFQSEKESIQYATYFGVAGQTCSWLMLESSALYQRYGIKEEISRNFIDSNLVTSIIGNILEKEKKEQTLGNAKANMKAWLKKIQSNQLIEMEADSLFETHLRLLPESSFEVNVPVLKSTLAFKDQWFRFTNEELNKGSLDYDKLMKAVRNEQDLEGTDNAFNLISSFAENNRHDITLLREVAFQLSNWNLDGKSYELCKRLIASRPAEPPTYKQIAHNLLKMGKTDLALLYYDIAYLTYWDSRFDGFEIINAIEYYKLLTGVVNGKYKATDMSFVKARLAEIDSFLTREGIAGGEADLMVVITWNTDNTDVDLHVKEPRNEVCNYSHTRTLNGGILTNDATDGFGPETYIMQKAPAGKYTIDIDYFTNSRVKTDAKSTVQVTAYKNWGRANEQVFQKIVELKRTEPRKRNNRDDDEDGKQVENVLTIQF